MKCCSSHTEHGIFPTCSFFAGKTIRMALSRTKRTALIKLVLQVFTFFYFTPFFQTVKRTFTIRFAPAFKLYSSFLGLSIYFLFLLFLLSACTVVSIIPFKLKKKMLPSDNTFSNDPYLLCVLFFNKCQQFFLYLFLLCSIRIHPLGPLKCDRKIFLLHGLIIDRFGISRLNNASVSIPVNLLQCFI